MLPERLGMISQQPRLRQAAVTRCASPERWLFWNLHPKTSVRPSGLNNSTEAGKNAYPYPARMPPTIVMHHAEGNLTSRPGPMFIMLLNGMQTQLRLAG